MSYTVIDLLDKAIVIAEKRKELYNELAVKTMRNSSLYIFVNVFIKNTDRTIEYYKQLKSEANNTNCEEIAFVVYDKISFLINEFNQKIFFLNNLSIKSLLKSSLDIEKDVLALFIDIQGRLVKSKEDTNTAAYKILSKVIIQKERNIKELQSFIKTYSFQ
ncbi:hypothetical protein [Clostridium aciditolerans]|uniref:Uncharacterized protein n=1 Tax=Clostridium aciditolerans TaxID=339861 RepID=A0A934HT98_9CLOT|nr:hypothetical protein [Clostridium aciditolerans]MBI6873920.1 hypothetical protein [Clostridium aciditolerans]